jgi:hypothetical protein
MNYLEEDNFLLHHVMIVRPWNKLCYCYLVDDEYINIMTGLTEDIHNDVLSIVPVEIVRTSLGVEKSYDINANYNLDNGQWFRLRKDMRATTELFLYNHVDILMCWERYRSIDDVIKRYTIDFDTIEFVNMSYKIVPLWKPNYEN